VGERTTQEELKAEIYELYSKLKDEPSSDRRQVYLVRLWEKASKWCENYILKKEKYQTIKPFSRQEELEFTFNGMGDEIFITITNFLKKDKMPQEVFIPYLYKSLVNAGLRSGKDFFSEQDEKGRVKNCYLEIGKGGISQTRVTKEIEKKIRTEEKNEGRQLTINELIPRIQRSISLREETLREYLVERNKKILPDTVYDDKGEKVSIFDFIPGRYSTPEDDAIEDMEIEIIKDALETVLNKEKDKTKAVYREFFTLHYIKGNKDYPRLSPVLDNELLETVKKSGKIPTQYEIYKKHYPNVQESTAHTNASKLKDKFFADLDKAIKKRS